MERDRRHPAIFSESTTGRKGRDQYVNAIKEDRRPGGSHVAIAAQMERCLVGTLVQERNVADLTSKLAAARKYIAAVFKVERDNDMPAASVVTRFRRNLDSVAASQALLELFGDVAAFVYAASQASEYDLKAHWQIDPAPLVTLNSPRRVRQAFHRLFGCHVAELEVDYEQALALFNEMNSRRTLGKSTAAKMAYLKPITGLAFKQLTPHSLQGAFPEVIEATIKLLKRQALRLQRQAVDCAHIDRQMLLLSDLRVRYRLKARFDGYPPFVENPDLFYKVYADEIAQMLAEHADNPCFTKPAELAPLHYLRKKGIEVAFARRDAAFLSSGDFYGDCTASEVRSQVDPEIANIHWTVYAWLLDPYYRVLDVYFNGRRALKGHLLPLIIHGRRVLMLDAIETIPSIRDYLRGKPNRNISKSVYARRKDLLQALFATVKALAESMGVEAVYVDKYSNTKWVRSEVGKLPADSYHIREVIKPFKNNLINSVIYSATGAPAEDVREEIQARNISLMDQQLRPNYKEVGVLMGRREDYFIAMRGI